MVSYAAGSGSSLSHFPSLKKVTNKKATTAGSAVKKIAVKKKGTKHAPKKAAGGPPKVRVQMFRQGLGDSFLVTLDHGGPDERRMLIDCGTLGNKFSDTDTAAVAAHLLAVVDDDDKRIDVLVATHEHMDHVSGFRNHLRPVLKGNVDEVWLAWTEKPKDPDAERLAKFKGDLGVALQRVSQGDCTVSYSPSRTFSR